LGAVGEIEQGLASIEMALSRCERNGERWYIADLLRIKGELILGSNDPQATVKAETEFSSSIEWARRQGALSWELRAATSLARLLRDQGRSAEATALLQPVYDRFTEGFAPRGPASLVEALLIQNQRYSTPAQAAPTSWAAR